MRTCSSIEIATKMKSIWFCFETGSWISSSVKRAKRLILKTLKVFQNLTILLMILVVDVLSARRRNLIESPPMYTRFQSVACNSQKY